jgi:hypothetical protein
MNHQSNQSLFSSTFYLPCFTSRLLYKLALSILFDSLPISTSLCLTPFYTPFYPPFYPSHFTASTFSHSYAILLSNPRILHSVRSRYIFVLRNRVARAANSVLINAYPFALVLISVRVFILSLLLVIIYKKAKESPLSNWLKSTLHKSILYNLKVKTSFKGRRFPTLIPQVLRLPSTS